MFNAIANAIASAELRVAQLRRDLETAEADLRYVRANERRHTLFANVMENIKEGKRINAIKELRGLPEDGTIGLRDAKDIIEFICNNFNPK